MSELAMTASRKARLTAMAEAGDKGAGAALALLEQPDPVPVVGAGGHHLHRHAQRHRRRGGLQRPVAAWLQAWGVGARAALHGHRLVVVTVITFITIVFGELVPKRIGQLYPETVARWWPGP
jgi:putative hemolysin